MNKLGSFILLKASDGMQVHQPLEISQRYVRFQEPSFFPASCDHFSELTILPKKRAREASPRVVFTTHLSALELEEIAQPKDKPTSANGKDVVQVKKNGEHYNLLVSPNQPIKKQKHQQ